VGVVYLAHDTKLDRSVAIKSLPAEVMANPKARSRFSREARVLASLNHPNIAAIYEELQEVEGVAYLILEYVPGQTLAEQIAKGPFKLEEVLSIALQIAEAVAAAHEHDVIHRDLKPGNIKITPEGKVKVLDFGLAKAVGGETADQQSTVTEPGRVIGTPAYMSPEQARGKPTDKRSDIWSFGCVLYEMLTGRVPFKGETISDTLANILQTEPNWEALPQTTPANIRSLLRHCLRKDPRWRLQHIGDAGIEISDTISPNTSSWGEQAPQTRHPSPLSLRQVIILCLACLVLGIVITEFLSWIFLSKKKLPVSRGTRTSSELFPEKTSLYLSRGGSIAISPNGRHIAYVCVGEDNIRRLYLRPLDQVEQIQSEPIPKTEGAISPFFRQDGQWIGFFAQDKLKRVSIRGGEPDVLCKVPPGPCGGSWGPGDMIIFSGIYHSGLSIVSASRKTSAVFTTVDANNGEFGHLWPEILPGEEGVLYTVWGGDSFTDYRTMIKWQGIDEPQELLLDSSFARYVPTGQTGHIVFLRGGSLWAVEFDIDHPGPKAIRGESHILLEGLKLGATKFGGAQFAFSRDEGALFYVSGTSPLGLVKGNLFWVDREGNPELVGAPREYYNEWSRPRLSPDGTQLALSVTDNTNLLVYDMIRGGDFSLLTTMKGCQLNAVWEPGGTHIAFSNQGPDSPPHVYWQPWDDSGMAECLHETGNANMLTSFLPPNGEVLALTVVKVVERQFPETSDICLLWPETKEFKKWTDTESWNEWGADFSPDGKWVAYTSDESGKAEVWIRQYPDGKKKKVSTGGGSEAAWGPDEKELELFYRNGKSVMRVKIDTESGFDPLFPEPLFEDHYMRAAFTGHRNYDISRDGKRFLMIKRVDEQAAPVTRLHVVVNWFDELKRRVPTGKKK
jgi:serine/threonine-protein kinase